MKILVMPNNLTELDNFKEADGFIIGIQNLSWFVPLEIHISDLKSVVSTIRKLDKQVFISLNKLMYNDDIPLLEEYLLTIEDMMVDGIVYDDLSVLNLATSLSLKTNLVWFGVHSFTNYYSANYWYNKGVKYGILSTEITLDKILEIQKNTNMFTMMYGYGYLPMFVSSRSLLTSYCQYIDIPKEDKVYHMFEKNSRQSYPTYEHNTQTIILSSNVINIIEELPLLNDKIDYLILSSLNISDVHFIKIFQYYVKAFDYLNDTQELKHISDMVTLSSPAETDKGFLYKETIYKVKNNDED